MSVETRSASDLTVIELTMHNTALSCADRMVLIARTVANWDHATTDTPDRFRAEQVEEGHRYRGRIA